MKRKFLKSLLSVLLIAALLAAPVSALASNAYILKVKVPGGSITRVRSASGEIISKLSNGAKVLYWGEKKGQMLKVMSASGQSGYIYQNHLKTYGAMNSKQLYRATKTATVYSRSGSSMRARGSISKGTPVIVYSMSGKWAYVRSMSGAGGYIKKNKLKRML